VATIPRDKGSDISPNASASGNMREVLWNEGIARMVFGVMISLFSVVSYYFLS